ncbi:UNVERIFIED_CONTAM: hypothetical protein HDU68_012539 [Siphonaria sp. JEL0065]|nr:hypothetical protein HDU68_012539 [Siphonaria sp. JEL0065]
MRFLDPKVSEFDCETLVTSTRVTPKSLLVIRVFILAYALFVFLFTLVLDVKEHKTFWGYFTYWTFFGIIVYFVSAVYNSAVYVYGRGLKRLQARPNWVKFINWYLYMIPATCAYIVTAVFWVLLFPTWTGPCVRLWLTASLHGANALFMISEFLLGRIPLVYQLLVPHLLTIILYLAISFVYHSETGFWSYSFLDTSKKMFWAYYLGIGLFFILVFVGIVTLHRWRDTRRERGWTNVIRLEGEAVELKA